MHIPQGDPLVKEDCENSFQQACAWFGTERPYLCHSWLLYPKLRELLKPESNIIRFQELFTLLDTDMEGTEAEQRIFGKFCQIRRAIPKNRSAEGGKEVPDGREKAGETVLESICLADKNPCLVVTVQS